MSASNSLRIRYMIDNCEIAGPNITAIETVCGEVWNNRAGATAGATPSPPPTTLNVVKHRKHRKPMSAERRTALSIAAKARALVAKAGKKAKTLAAAS